MGFKWTPTYNGGKHEDAYQVTDYGEHIPEKTISHIQTWEKYRDTHFMCTGAHILCVKDTSVNKEFKLML